MPKRLVDGDAIATSKKLKPIKFEYRVHYPYLLTLALANGSFECDPNLIWQQYFALLYPEITPAFISEMLDEFAAAKLLFRWESGGHQWGLWVGQTKSARLPSKSEQARMKCGPAIPTTKLAKWLSPTGRVNREVINTLRCTGLGLGVGEGEGVGIGVRFGEGEGAGSGIEAAPAVPTESAATSASSLTFSTTTPESNDNEGDELEEPKANPVSVKPHHVRFLTLLLQHLLDDNEHCKEVPAGFRKLWDADFAEMLKQYDLETVLSVVWLSQVPCNTKYFVRAKAIKDNLDSLVKQLIEDRSQKAIKIMQAKYPSLQSRVMTQAKQEV